MDRMKLKSCPPREDIATALCRKSETGNRIILILENGSEFPVVLRGIEMPPRDFTLDRYLFKALATPPLDMEVHGFLDFETDSGWVEEEFLSRSLDLLNLPGPLHRRLFEAGYKTIGDLTGASKRNLLRIKNVGEIGIDRVEKSLAKFGFGFAC